MKKYSLTYILGYGVKIKSPHITNKSTIHGRNIIIRPLIALLIVKYGGGGGGVAVLDGTTEGVVQVAEAEAKDVDTEILMTFRSS